MAATGFTPIQLYRTTTASAQPSAGNLADGELAINLTDKKLYAKDASNNVFVLADASSGGTTATNLAGGAAGSVPYQTGANATTFLGIGTAAQVLQVNSGATAPEWVNTSGTGDVARTTSPSFTTPSLGAATALSINSLTLTTSTGTFTLANGKTLTVNNSLTLSGTDATTMTFPSTSATIARTDAAQSFTGTQTFLSNPVLDAGTANGVLYLDGSKVVTSGSALTFDGSTLATTGALTVDGNVTLGNASTDTVRVNGYMGVGGAPSSSAGVILQSNALIGVSVYGLRAAITGTSSNTTSVQSIYSAVSTAAGSYTVDNVNGARFANAVLGSGVTITNQRGLYIEDQTRGTNNYGLESLVSSGTNKWNIYASGTAQNYFAGNVGIGTSAPSASTALTVASTALTSTQQFGVSGQITGSSAATSLVAGVDAYPQTANASFTTTNVAGFYARAGLKGASNTASNWHGLYIADQTQGTNNYGITSLVSSGTNKWNIYASGTANNAFAGNVRIGSTTAPTNALDVTGAMTVSGNTTLGDATTDTVTVNGYMGVGGAATSSQALRVVSTALTGTGPLGIVSSITAPATATSSVTAGYFEAATAAASFTISTAIAIRAANAILGAGSTITNQYGLLVDDQTRGTNNYGITSGVSSGANKWNIYASGTAANYFAGNVGIGTSSFRANIDADSSGTLVTPKLQLEGTTASDSSASLTRNSSGSPPLASSLYFSRTRGSSVGSNTAVIDGDFLGRISFNGADGTNLVESANIWATVVGSPSTGVVPGALNFGTTSVSASIAPVERLKLTPTEAVFNDPGNDYDFRVESDTNTHALFVEGSSGNVGIGTSSPGAKLEVSDTSAAAATALVQLTGQNNFELNIQSLTTTNSTVGARYNFAVNSSNGEFSWSNSGGTRMYLDSSGNLIQTVNTTAATLTTNQTLTFSIVDNSTLRISVRGSDGTTRTATVALT